MMDKRRCLPVMHRFLHRHTTCLSRRCDTLRGVRVLCDVKKIERERETRIGLCRSGERAAETKATQYLRHRARGGRLPPALLLAASVPFERRASPVALVPSFKPTFPSSFFPLATRASAVGFVLSFPRPACGQQLASVRALGECSAPSPPWRVLRWRAAAAAKRLREVRRRAGCRGAHRLPHAVSCGHRRRPARGAASNSSSVSLRCRGGAATRRRRPA